MAIRKKYNYIDSKTGPKLARRFIKLRRDLGMSQGDFSAKVGKNYAIISTYESGSTTISLIELENILDKVGYEVEFHFIEKDENRRPT